LGARRTKDASFSALSRGHTSHRTSLLLHMPPHMMDKKIPSRTISHIHHGPPHLVWSPRKENLNSNLAGSTYFGVGLRTCAGRTFGFGMSMGRAMPSGGLTFRPPTRTGGGTTIPYPRQHLLARYSNHYLEQEQASPSTTINIVYLFDRKGDLMAHR